MPMLRKVLVILHSSRKRVTSAVTEAAPLRQALPRNMLSAISHSNIHPFNCT